MRYWTTIAVCCALALVCAAAPAVAGAGKAYTNSIGMQFRPIPAGSFTMGDDEGEDDEKPAHKVTITKPFYLGTYEVTQAQYEKVMGKNPSRFKGASKPVENVSWNDAKAFCKKLTALAKGGSYRLPTEAEWEYACRAGTVTDLYWGPVSASNKYAWVSKRPNGPTNDVGKLRPNAWGLHDMSGNVWEWCEDAYAAPYPPGPRTDPKGPSEGTSRLLRGGSWYYPAATARSANRRNHVPERTDGDAGFRVVFVPEG